MASNVSKAAGKDYRGVIMPDPRFVATNLARSDSSITEANPRPGVPVASQNTGLVLETSGNMPNIAGVRPALTLTTNKGGMPGIQDGRHTWEANYANPAGYQTRVGWDSPNSISRYEKITKSGSGTTYLGGCLRLQDNSVLLTYTDTNGTTISVRASRKLFDAAGHAATGAVSWSWNAGATVISSLTTQDIAVVPGTTCALQLPEGRVHLYWIAEASAVSTFQYFQLWMSVSDDNGTTWTAPQKASLNETIRSDGTYGATTEGFEMTRARVAYSNGQVLLILAGTAHDTGNGCTNTLWQYASNDLGNSFTRVSIPNPAPGGTADTAGGYIVGDLPAADGLGYAGGAAPDIAVASDGVFVVSYAAVGRETGVFTARPKTKRLGTATTKWTDVTPVALTDSAFPVFIGTPNSPGNNIFGGVNTTIAADETGTLSLSWQKDTLAGAAVGTSAQALSFDGGATWLPQHAIYTDTNPADTGKSWPWWQSGDTSTFPTDQCSTFQCGRLLVFALPSVGTEQGASVLRTGHLVEIDLGGYTTASRPFKYPEEADSNMIISEVNWLPFDRFTDTTGWTFAGLGSEVLTVLDYTTLTTAGGQTIDISNTTLGAVTTGQHRTWVMFECLVSAGTSRFEVRIGDGANVQELAFEFSATQFQVYDYGIAAAIYGPAGSTAPAGWNQVLLSLDWSTATVSVWSRASAVDTEIRQWKRLLTRAVVTPAASANAIRLKVGQPALSTSRWREVHFGGGASGFPIDTDATWPRDDLYGRTYSPFPVHIYSGDGVKVRAVDGPSWDGDVFTITQRHDYGAENVFTEVSPSPRRTWRSTGLTQQDIVVTLDNSNDPAPLLGTTLGIGVFNANFQQLQVSYRTVAAGAWTALGTLLFNQGQTALKWVRDGHTIRPNPAAGATSATDYYTYNILEDSHIQIEDNNGTVVRAITRNSEGTWTDTTKLRPHIYCAGVVATDLASGVAGEIWSKDGVILIHDMPDVYQLKFTIPAGLTAEGYFEIGSLIVGHVAYFGRQYARGRNLQWEPNYNLTTGRGGTRRAQSLGPSRRSVEFSWANENETDTSQLTSNPPNPDYITSGGSLPVANPADTAYKMAGLVEHLRGAVGLCVYLSKVPVVAAETTDTIEINRNLFMVGRIVSEPRIETALGDEWGAAGELVRIATVAFDEEV